MSSIKISLLAALLIAVACRHQEQKNAFISTRTTINEMLAAEAGGTDRSIEKNVFPQNVTLNSIIDGKKYRLKTNDSKVTELYIDYIAVDVEKIQQYKPITDKMIKEFWIQVALVNTTGKKINEKIDSLKSSIDHEKDNVQTKSLSIKKSLR